MFVISFNICLFIYFSVKYAIQSNDCDVFVNKQSISLSIYLSIVRGLFKKFENKCKNKHKVQIKLSKIQTCTTDLASYSLTQRQF